MSTGEILRPASSGNRTANVSAFLVRLTAGLAVTAILGGIAAWSDGRITAATLAEQRAALIEHKTQEEKRLNDLSAEIRALGAEMRIELKEIRQAVERKR